MKPYIGKNKIFSISLPLAEESFIEDCMEQSPNASTLVFCGKEDDVEERLELLNKILSAAKVGPDDRLIINKSKHPAIRLRMLTGRFASIKFILLFDQSPKAIGLNAEVRPYTITKVGDFHVLRSDALHVLESNDQLKRLLWTSLKDLFAV